VNSKAFVREQIYDEMARPTPAFSGGSYALIRIRYGPP